jgi:ribosome-binding factor A
VIDDLKDVIIDHPGSAEVVLEMDTATGERRLRLGEAYRVKHTPTLRAELEQVLAQARAISAASLAS